MQIGIVGEDFDLPGLKPAEETGQIEPTHAPSIFQAIDGCFGQPGDGLTHAESGHEPAGEVALRQGRMDPGDIGEEGARFFASTEDTVRAFQHHFFCQDQGNLIE